MSLIYVEKKNVLETDFLNLLAGTRERALSALMKNSLIRILRGDPEKFETLIYEAMCRSAKATPFEGSISHTTAHAFPDIVAKKYFGVEVKMTSSDKWISTGNSILETTRVEDVGRIYLLFGKLGGEADIKYRAYQECLYDVGVTHSPRYKINMNLPLGESIFERMGIGYDVLRQSADPIRCIKDFYRAQLKRGEELWWIDARAEDTSVSTVIQPFSSLSSERRAEFMVEFMILFPEVFGGSSLKFERPAAYLVSNYSLVSSNLRDLFTSGGKRNIRLARGVVRLPRIYAHLFERAKDIATALPKFPADKLRYYWRVEDLAKDRLVQWRALLAEKSIREDVEEVFDAGLSR